MKLTTIQLAQWFNKINNRRWVVISMVICLTVALLVMHTLSARSYSFSHLLGLASGFGTIAAFWLTYGLANPK